MKVFVPVSDDILRDNGDLYGKLVPFNPEFALRSALARNVAAQGQRPVSSRKPRNWISEYNLEQAMERLYASGT